MTAFLSIADVYKYIYKRPYLSKNFILLVRQTVVVLKNRYHINYYSYNLKKTIQFLWKRNTYSSLKLCIVKFWKINSGTYQ